MWRLCLAMCLAVFPVHSVADDLGWAEMQVMLLDEDVQDWIELRHTGGCGVILGALDLDFTRSRGSVVIDTEYGGRGTKDPSEVRILEGPISLGPVADGTQNLTIRVEGLAPGGRALLTLDFDIENAWFESRRVMAMPEDFQGTTARFRTDGQPDHGATYGKTGVIRLKVPTAPCDGKLPALIS
jgi:hypothetical protein